MPDLITKRNIPTSWSIKRFKYCAQICNGGEYSDIEVEEGGYPVIGSGGEFARASKFSYYGKSVLLGRKGTVDKPLFVDGAFWCVDTMFYTKIKDFMYEKYLYYCALCFPFDYYVTSTALPSMTQRDLGSQEIAVPSRKEQKAIADFLDKEWAQIDSIAADLGKQIELLQQYKRSLITETVTKGLDKSVPIKDSGVEWIGEIPEHWRLKRLKYIAKLKTGTTPPGNEGINYDENGINWFTPSDFLPNMQLDTSEKYIDRETICYANIQTYPRGSVLLVAIGATVGKIGISKNNAYSNQQITAVIPQHISGNYLLYYLASKSPYIKDNALYTTLPIINNSYLQNITIVVPPTTEQEKIVEFLNRKCSIIDELIEDKNKLLLRLQQHKKSLIYEVVTGKKEV